MDDTLAHVEIPDRALFKAAEVCELLRVQPFVLRTWEAEFPGLGMVKAGTSSRVYRRSDVEQVVRIRHLLLVEGLTLAGARRKLEDQEAPIGADAPVIDELMGRNARERITEVKRSLQSLLDLLSGQVTASEFRLAPPPAASAARRRGEAVSRKPLLRGRSSPSRPPASPRRKRSA